MGNSTKEFAANEFRALDDLVLEPGPRNDEGFECSCPPPKSRSNEAFSAKSSEELSRSAGRLRLIRRRLLAACERRGSAVSFAGLRVSGLSSVYEHNFLHTSASSCVGVHFPRAEKLLTLPNTANPARFGSHVLSFDRPSRVGEDQVQVAAIIRAEPPSELRSRWPYG